MVIRMNNYKVYIHIFPNNKVYIGMTCLEPKERWKRGKAYKENRHLYNAINKYGWENIEHKILFDNLEKEEAELKEINLIKEYKANDNQYGYNIEYGGCHNGKTSEITRKRISEANKGKHNSPKTEFKKGHKPLNVRKVLCIESDVVYDTIKKASEDTDVMACHISQVCNGKRKSAGKLHWKFIEN